MNTDVIVFIECITAILIIIGIETYLRVKVLLRGKKPVNALRRGEYQSKRAYPWKQNHSILLIEEVNGIPLLDSESIGRASRWIQDQYYKRNPGEGPMHYEWDEMSNYRGQEILWWRKEYRIHTHPVNKHGGVIYKGDRKYFYYVKYLKCGDKVITIKLL